MKKSSFNSSNLCEKTEDKVKGRERIIVSMGINCFGERLKQAMRGMSNNELGRQSGMSETTIRKYLKGQIYPGIDSAAIVADACGVNLTWLITGIEQKDDDGSRGDFKENTLLVQLIERLSKQQREELTDLLITQGMNNVLALQDKKNIALIQLPDSLKKQIIEEYITGPEEIADGANRDQKVCSSESEEGTQQDDLAFKQSGAA